MALSGRQQLLLARTNALEHNVALYKVENGRRFSLRQESSTTSLSTAGASSRYPSAATVFSVPGSPPHFAGWDNTFADAGKVGLWTETDSVTYFDDFRVYPK